MLHRMPPPPLRRLPCAGRRSCSPAATADTAHSHSSGGRRRRSRRMKTTLAPSARFAWHLRCLLCSRRCPITQRLGLRASADRSPTPPTGGTRLASYGPAASHSYVLSTVTRRHIRRVLLSERDGVPARLGKEMAGENAPALPLAPLISTSLPPRSALGWIGDPSRQHGRPSRGGQSPLSTCDLPFLPSLFSSPHLTANRYGLGLSPSRNVGPSPPRGATRFVRGRVRPCRIRDMTLGGIARRAGACQERRHAAVRQ